MYLTIFLAAAAIIIGFLVGFMVVIRIRRAMDRRYGRKADRKRRRTERIKNRQERGAAAATAKAARQNEKNRTRAALSARRRHSSAGADNEQHISLKDRMVDKSDSRMEFDCMAEGIDPAEYIKQKRNQQDSQYNYAKRRQNNAEKGGW